MKNEKNQSVTLSKINHWFFQKPVFQNQWLILSCPFFIFWHNINHSFFHFLIFHFSFLNPFLIFDFWFLGPPRAGPRGPAPPGRLKRRFPWRHVSPTRFWADFIFCFRVAIKISFRWYFWVCISWRFKGRIVAIPRVVFRDDYWGIMAISTFGYHIFPDQYLALMLLSKSVLRLLDRYIPTYHCNIPTHHCHIPTHHCHTTVTF